MKNNKIALRIGNTRDFEFAIYRTTAEGDPVLDDLAAATEIEVKVTYEGTYNCEIPVSDLDTSANPIRFRLPGANQQLTGDYIVTVRYRKTAPGMEPPVAEYVVDSEPFTLVDRSFKENGVYYDNGLAVALKLSGFVSYGKSGDPGKSAYEIAVEHGYEGTEQEWLASLQGESAYEAAVSAGYEGAEDDFDQMMANVGSEVWLTEFVCKAAKAYVDEAVGVEVTRLNEILDGNYGG